MHFIFKYALIAVGKCYRACGVSDTSSDDRHFLEKNRRKI